MIYWLFQNYGPLVSYLEMQSSGDSRVYLTARIALASLLSFGWALLFGPGAIQWLKARFPERIDSASEQLNAMQAKKQATPTMGGLFIVAAIVLSTLICGNLSNGFVQLGLFILVTFASLGAYDDWIKLSTDRNGLTIRQKLIGQTLLALLAGLWLTRVLFRDISDANVMWPIGHVTHYLGIVYIVWAMIVTIGTSNAVNLTDGLDGLAGGCLIFSGLTYVGLTYVAGHSQFAEYLRIPLIQGAGEVAVVLGAMVGAILGFLWFNCYPAQVFMGDTGALSLGALLALGALVSRQEVLLLLCGGIFVIEALSVILQVGFFRISRKRLIRCSPLHNHYLLNGQHEMKIVVRFWIGSALMSILTLACLKFL